MQRLSSWALPVILGLVGVGLIILGTLDLDGEAAASLPPIATASHSPTQEATAEPSASPPATAEVSPSQEPTPSPSATPLPDDVTAVQLEVPSVGINVAVQQSQSRETDGFPPSDAAYILSTGSQPGRHTNSYVFAHALNHLFKPLWNVVPGAEVLVLMSDGTVLRYVVSEVRPNVACPADPDPALDPPNPPLALQIHPTCDEGLFWLAPTDHERLTLQTSQGYNRNWGELVIVAEPVVPAS